MEPEPEDLSDDEIDLIHEQGEAAAMSAWGPAGRMSPDCPYPEGSERADIWNFAFRNTYARENS